MNWGNKIFVYVGTVEKYFKNKQGIITVYFNNPLFSNKMTVSAILVALYLILFVAFITNTFLIFFQVFLGIPSSKVYALCQVAKWLKQAKDMKH